MKNSLALFVCLILFTSTFSTSVFTKIKLMNFKESNQKLSSTITSLLEKNSLLLENKIKELPSPESFNQNCGNLKYANGSYNVPKQMWYYKKKLYWGAKDVGTTSFIDGVIFPFTLGYELMELNIDFQYSYYYYQDSGINGMEFQLYLDDILIDEFSDKLETGNLSYKYQTSTLRGSVYRVCPGAHNLYLKFRRTGGAYSVIHQGVGATNFVTMIGYVS